MYNKKCEGCGVRSASFGLPSDGKRYELVRTRTALPGLLVASPWERGWSPGPLCLAVPTCVTLQLPGI